MIMLQPQIELLYNKLQSRRISTNNNSAEGFEWVYLTVVDRKDKSWYFLDRRDFSKFDDDEIQRIFEWIVHVERQAVAVAR